MKYPIFNPNTIQEGLIAWDPKSREFKYRDGNIIKSVAVGGEPADLGNWSISGDTFTHEDGATIIGSAGSLTDSSGTNTEDENRTATAKLGEIPSYGIPPPVTAWGMFNTVSRVDGFNWTQAFHMSMEYDKFRIARFAYDGTTHDDSVFTINSTGQIAFPILTIANVDSGSSKGAVTKEWVLAEIAKNHP